MQELQFETDGRKARWWGYGDFYCASPAGTRILLPYQSEPPHGDSYHRLLIGSKTIRGYVWSGYLRWSPCGRYFTCDWLEDLGGHREGATWVLTQTLRATLVVAPEELRFRVVLEPEYGDLHRLDEQQLWEVLLREEISLWEEFSERIDPPAESSCNGSSGSGLGGVAQCCLALLLSIWRSGKC